MQKQFILYGTSACHLCEDAEKLIDGAIQSHHIICSKKDITEDDTLLEKYGLSIPVIRCSETGDELNWPFNEQSLSAFINRQ